MPILLTFIFGTIIGSFLNVVIYRYGSGRSIGGRSGCSTCGRDLAWFEMVPLLSFVLLEAKCRKCKTHISWQYPVVELVTGLVFTALYIKFQYLVSFGIISDMLLYWLVFSLLMVIAVYDLRHKIIPDGMVYFFALLAFIALFFNLAGGYITIPSIWSIIAGPILALPFFLMWLVSGGRWIGLGDAKLALGIGFLLGLTQGVAALLLAFWIGAILGIAMVVIGNISGSLSAKKQVTLRTEIPFAPFMILGVFVVFIFGIDIYTIASWFQF